MPTGHYERYPGLNDGLPHEIRRCRKCLDGKPRDAFSPDRRNHADGLQSICKACRKAREREWRAANPQEHKRRSREQYMRHRARKDAYGREWNKKNPHKRHEYALRGRYGITAAVREAMIAAQGNACAICRRPFGASKKAPHTDHDHATGKVRGILCGGCNIVLGHLEKPGFSESAHAYLARHVAGGTHTGLSDL